MSKIDRKAAMKTGCKVLDFPTFVQVAFPAVAAKVPFATVERSKISQNVELCSAVRL